MDARYRELDYFGSREAAGFHTQLSPAKVGILVDLGLRIRESTVWDLGV